MVDLKVKLLGQSEVVTGGRVVTELLSSKAQALLAYLLLTRGIHTRTVLASLLWSDQPEAQAKKNLRNVLPQLREYFPDHIIITRQTVEYNTQTPVEVDVLLFERIVGGNLSQVAMPTLENALASYRGEFLEGFHVRRARIYENWLLQQRAYFHQLAVAGWEAVANHYAQRGQFVEVERAAGQLLAVEPFYEEGHRLMMQALAGLDRRADALLQFERCVNILRNELATEVSAETRTLYEQIKAGELAQPTTDVEEPAVEKARIVARDIELSQIESRFDHVLHNQAQLVWIKGESGSGKSSLLQAVVARMADSSMRHLAASGRQLTQSNDNYRIFRNLLKTLGTRWPDDERAVTDHVISKIEALARRQPVLLTFDNLHWADSASWVLFFEMVQRLKQTQVMILATYLSDWQTDPQWRVMLSELSHCDNCIRIDLDVASRREGVHFVDALIDRRPNQLSFYFRQRLYTLLNGHPRLTVAALAALEAKGMLYVDENKTLQLQSTLGWDDFAGDLAELLENWLLPLPLELRHLLSVASVEGDEFTAIVIHAALDVDLPTLAQQLGLLVRHYRLLEANETLQIGRKQVASYRFRYPIMRHYLYSQLTWLEQTTLAQQLGQALHQLYSIADPSV